MFNTGIATPSLADIAAVTRNNDGDGFGNGNGGWWVLIILLALTGGFGNGGYGMGNGGLAGYGFENAAVQRGFDNQAVINKLNGLENGVCDLGYASLAQANGINSNIAQSTSNIISAVNSADVNNMQNTNSLSRQLSDCCCNTREAISEVRHAIDTQACAINTNVHQTGDAIINNQNAGFQMLNNTINDRFTRLEIAQKDQRIAELEAALNRCDRTSELQAFSSQIINRLDPPAVPSYSVQNPHCCSPIPVRIQDDCCCGSRAC